MSHKQKTKPFQLFGYSIFHPLNVILLINIFFYGLQLVSVEPDTHASVIEQNLALRPFYFLSGMYWQVFSYGFLHSTFGLTGFLHIGMNMYGFYALGKAILPIIGSVRLTILYVLAQLGGGITIILNSVFQNFLASSQIFGEYYGHGMFLKDGSFINFDIIPTIGASGAVFGILTTFSLLFPNVDLYLLFIRIKSRYVVPVSLLIGFGLEKFAGVLISNAGHLGGAIVGYIFFHVFIKPNLAELVNKSISLDPIMETTVISIEAINQNTLWKIENFSSLDEKENYLLPKQVENANICPPYTFNTKDPYCLQCEWFANCMLRKVEKESNYSA
jgi:membrane associated rhomboid family serine protease